jgi:hypothetical protein
MACRAWRPVAQKLIHTRVVIDFQRVESVICGYQLDSLVCGVSSFQISTLSLQLDTLQEEFIPCIAQIVATTISSLILNFCNSDVDFHETLETFFSRSQRILNLCLVGASFGYDAGVITPTIKEVFSRLKQLDFIYCLGNVKMFIEDTPIPNLKSFRFESDKPSPSDDIDSVDAAVTNYGRNLISLNLSKCYMSSANLLKIKDCCFELEKLTISDTEDAYSLFDMKIIASLPRLKRLVIGEPCLINVGALSALTGCCQLNHLSIKWQPGLTDVIRVIGRNLFSLELLSMKSEGIDSIIEYCPNLQYLVLTARAGKRIIVLQGIEKMKKDLKNGLKKLSSLKVNGTSVRLGDIKW